jgi:ATP-dependent Clp endopeptidase proteolytic subunit ClpP
MTIFNKVENGFQINIDDEIGFWGITHQDFTNQLNEIGEQDVQLNIASYGGAVSDAFAIYNSLKSHKGRIVANIYGDSASSATFIAMAADEIRIVDNALFLIHNVWGGVTGEADDLRKAADDMDKVNSNIIDVYKKRTGLNKNTIKSLMNKGDWWTAKEAKANGFVDAVVEPSEIINRSETVLMNCANEEMKEALKEKVNQLNNNKNQIKMTEENKSWFSGKFDELMNSFNKKEEVAPKVEEQPKEETISKEEVSEMLNSVKGEISKAKEENDAIVNSKEEEIKNLKAELEKLNAVATEAKAENKSPEGDNKKEVETTSPFINKTVARLNNKYKGILKIK